MRENKTYDTYLRLRN